MKWLIVLLVGMSFTSSAQGPCTPSVKGLYVNDFKFIVGNLAEEDELLSYAQDSGFNYLILYNLYYIHNNLFDITGATSSLPLSNFINKAKSLYGIHSVAGVGETYNSFGNIHAYNQLHLGDPFRLIDVYNLEHEFWNSGSTGPGGYYCTTYLEPNGLNCDTADAFQFYLEELCQIDSLCDAHAYLQSECYIGNPTEGQCTQLSGCADRVLVHYYRTSDTYGDGTSIYNYKSYRLPALAAAAEMSRVMPIFACTEEFMGPWLESNSHNQALDTWINGVEAFDDESGDWLDNNCLEGSVWFKYTCMNDEALVTSQPESEKNYSLQVFPNPTTGSVQVKGTGELTVWNSIGELVLSEEVMKSGSVDLSAMANGIYFIRLRSEERIAVTKLMKH